MEAAFFLQCAQGVDDCSSHEAVVAYVGRDFYVGDVAADFVEGACREALERLVGFATGAACQGHFEAGFPLCQHFEDEFGGCCRSESMGMTASPVAKSSPAVMAASLPKLRGRSRSP